MDYPPQTQGLTPHPADLNPPPALNSYQQPLHSQSQRHLSGSPYSQRSRRPLSYQPQPTYLDAGVRSNTSSPHRRQSPVPGRFTEEWDASQRGSSILDNRRGRDSPVMSSSGAGPAAIGTAAMQRSSSVNSYAAGDDRGLPQRGNTLKKKASMRRSGTGSLVRSSSRRSARAGSVKSLMLQTADADELQSPFYCPVPTTGNPTDVLAARFQSMLFSFFYFPLISCIMPWRISNCCDASSVYLPALMSCDTNSLEKNLERSYCVLPRNPIPLRAKGKINHQAVQCLKQYCDPRFISPNCRNRRCPTNDSHL